MNAGTNYTKAKRQAQANADRDGHARQLWIYNGVWWIERVGTSARGETTSRIPDAEIVQPTEGGGGKS